MPQSLSRVYLHLIFSTKNREAWFQNKELRKEVHAYLAGIAKELDCIPVEIGGVADHVHLLILQGRTRSLAEIVKELKRNSSGWLHGKEDAFRAFAWQAGYGVFSVSQSQVEAVAEYIRNQEAHHRKESFQDEFRAFLKKHAIQCDERFLWD